MAVKRKRKTKIIPVNRRVAQLMIEIQDELEPIRTDIQNLKNVEHADLTILIVEETQLCLKNLIEMIQSK